MERAEKLKQHLAEGDKSNKKKPSAVGANGKVSNGSGKGKYVTSCLHGLYDTTLLNIYSSTGMVAPMTNKTPSPRSSGVRYKERS